MIKQSIHTRAQALAAIRAIQTKDTITLVDRTAVNNLENDLARVDDYRAMCASANAAIQPHMRLQGLKQAYEYFATRMTPTARAIAEHEGLV